MANKETGWISLSRGITDNFLWKSREPYDVRSAWIDLILMANYEDKTMMTQHGDVIEVKRGSLLTSIGHLAERWNWSEGKVRRYLDTLSGTQMIVKTGTRSGTLISLVKYGDFNDRRRADGRPDGRPDGRADGRRLNNINKENKENKRASARPASMQETIIALQQWAKQEEQA